MSTIPFPRRQSPEPIPEELDLADMRALSEGDEAAFARIVHRYWSRLVHYADSFLDDKESAEDIAQETCLRLWEGRFQWQSTGRVSAYLYRITRNLALDSARKRKVRSRFRRMASRRTPPPGSPPLKLLEDRDLGDRISRALDALSPRRREAFMLAHMHDLTYREAADVMGVSPQTVANQVSAALGELRAALEDLR